MEKQSDSNQKELDEALSRYFMTGIIGLMFFSSAALTFWIWRIILLGH